MGGYWFITHWNYTRFRAVRESGYHLLFNSALYGIPLYCVARLYMFVLDLAVPSLTMFWDVHVPEPFTSEVMLSLFFGWYLPLLLNLHLAYDEDDCARRAAGDFGEHMELVIDRAMRDDELVELSLRSRKGYVGYARESGIGKVSGTDIVLAPVRSGYRDEKTLKLILDTDYTETFGKYIEDFEAYIEEIEDFEETTEQDIEEGSFRTIEEFRDFLVIIPLSEVVVPRQPYLPVPVASLRNVTQISSPGTTFNQRQFRH